MITKEFNPSITASNYLIRNRLLKSIQSLAPSLKGKLMDFGCGQKPYRSLFTVDEYIGVDFENPGHSHSNEAIDVYYDGKSLPFPDATFDSIFSSEVFEHVFNLYEILPELNRVLKPGGLFLLTCPFAFCEHEQPNDFARYTSFAIKHLLQQNGFEIVEQRKTGNSIEAIYQLRLVYINQHITPVVRKIPVFRSLFRLLIYTSYNLAALLFTRILPQGNDLYMNNVILCRKTNS
ncbi:MAG: class I SAM-dependent methyltransferase [Chitinophagaceae bacterium]|nr:MAG: class I SAM-dependent methyltransferase [Chitinophagaceae bacterium]